MKIGFFTNTYLPVNYGIEVSMETFRKGLESKGNKVYIFAPYYKGYIDKNPNVFRFKSLKIFRKKGVYIPFPFLPKNKKLKEVLNKDLDIIHAHSPFTMGLLARHIAKKQGIPFIYTHHVLFSAYAKLHFKRRLIPPFVLRKYTTNFANSADLVIAPSLKIKRFLKNNGVKKEIEILPTGINTKIFKKNTKSKEILKKKLKIPSKNKILLFVGRIELEKNPLFLIRSLAEIIKERKDVVLLMIGSGTLLEKIREVSKKLKLSKNLKLLGSVPHKKIPFYYQGSDLFVFSSLTETQGIIILEAAASGIPVIALKDDPFLDVIKNGKNGFLVPRQDPKIFAKKVLKVLNDKKLYNKLSKNAQITAKSFSEKKQAEKLIKIYKKLI